MNQTAIDIAGVTKFYGSGPDAVRALHDIHFQIQHNEFFTLLGPSGCGKTTLLRIIGGFEDISEGTLRLFGEDIQELPPNRRPVNTVFQHYALFPHMSIRDNVGFGLKMQGRPPEEIHRRSDQMLELVRLSEYAERRPSQLSGGQKQRVALARALAPEPKVLLLDEPLSALDLKLRQSMRHELKQIREELGITFIFVTHDQEEALIMSDRIAVMSHGALQQVGTPEEIYNHPLNRFVADFIGETNLVEVQVREISDSGATVTFAGHTLACSVNENQAHEPGEIAHMSIRPEHIGITPGEETEDALRATVLRKIFLGTDIHVACSLPTGEELVARVQSTAAGVAALSPGDGVTLDIDPHRIVLLGD